MKQSKLTMRLFSALPLCLGGYICRFANTGNLEYISTILVFTIIMLNCRKVLQERNSNSSDNSFYFRIYLLVLGVYAAIRLFLALLLKFPACHALSEMSDQFFFQFFKWIYQVSYFYYVIVSLLFQLISLLEMTWYLCLFNNLIQERYYVGRGLYERMSDYCRLVIMQKMKSCCDKL